MLRAGIALLLLLVGCSPTGLRRVNRAGAVLVVGGMALDWAGTRHAASGGWRDCNEGGFPARVVMGEAPSPHTVDLYFAASTVLIIAAAQLLPERIRPAVYGVVIGVEAMTVAGNVRTTETGLGF